VRTIAFSHRVPSADELWDGLLAGTVRTSALILRQPEATRRRIRDAFDRLVSDYRRGDALRSPCRPSWPQAGATLNGLRAADLALPPTSRMRAAQLGGPYERPAATYSPRAA
jgi:hypothetical protein